MLTRLVLSAESSSTPAHQGKMEPTGNSTSFKESRYTVFLSHRVSRPRSHLNIGEFCYGFPQTRPFHTTDSGPV